MNLVLSLLANRYLLPDPDLGQSRLLPRGKPQ